MRRPRPERRSWSRLLLYLLTSHLFNHATPLDIKMCGGPLGMESGAIPDSSITASSHYVPNVGPLNARLNTDRQGGGWCPFSQLEKGVREYIQVALGGTMLVTGVATQGRHDRGRGQEYSKEYSVEYWRTGLAQWKPYIRWDGKTIFPGNTDTVTIVQHSLTPPVHAESLRIVPHSIHTRTICLRFEVYGCLDDSGVVSYSAPVGSAEMGDHSDRMYDGVEEGGMLKDGLGRLTDGQVGQDFFLIDMGYAKGSGWVGWKNSSFVDGYMEIVFRLDRIRNVTQVDFFSNNYFSRRVQVFNTAILFFSIGGRYFNADPVVLKTEADKVKETARNVSVVIPGGIICRFVKTRLYFSNEWIMLSEVYIQSKIVNNPNVTDEVDQRSFDDLNELNLVNELDGKKSGPQMEIVLGSLTVVIIILAIIFIVVLIVNRHNKYAEEGSAVLRDRFTMKINMKDLFVNWTPNPPNPNEIDEELHNYVPRPPMIIDEDLNQRPGHSTPKNDRKHSFVSTSADALGGKTTVSLAAPVYNSSILPNILQNEFTMNELNHYEEAHFEEYPPQYPPCKYREPTAMEYYESIRTTMPAKRSSFTATSLRERKHEMNTSFGGPSREFKFKTQVRPNEPRRMSMRGVRDGRAFGLADLSKMYKTNEAATGPRDKKENPATTIWNVAPSMTLPFTGLDKDVVSIPFYCLQLTKKFGHCPYGEISIYETQNITEIVPNSTKIVQVKAAYFKKGENCIDYMKELRFLSSIRHTNICKVLGIITSEMPPLVVGEYTAAGDLCQLLRTAHNVCDEPIRFPLLTFLGIQICSAMKYLESRCIVHKDLATRNCLVFPGNRVKVSDSAICSDLYKGDYHTLIGEKLIPVRWLSWESILLDRYTCQSTVWSFAVTLWEILSLCKTTPYCKLELEDLIHNAEQLFYGHELKEILPKPTQCPADLYQLMAKCWRRDDAARPTFEELYQFLVLKFKKNVPNDYRL